MYDCVRSPHPPLLVTTHLAWAWPLTVGAEHENRRFTVVMVNPSVGKNNESAYIRPVWADAPQLGLKSIKAAPIRKNDEEYLTREEWVRMQLIMTTKP